MIKKQVKYKRLSSEDRFYIEQRLSLGESQASIAKTLNRTKCTLSREIERNSTVTADGRMFYSYKLAESKAKERQKQGKTGKTKLSLINAEQKAVFDKELRDRSSPEQIAAVLKMEHKFPICGNSIYTYISKDRRAGGILYKFLRNKGKKYRPKELKKSVVANKNKQSIEKRTKKSILLKKFGNWEMDTIFGLDQKSFLLTMVDMSSQYTVIIKLKDKTAETTQEAILNHFKSNSLLKISTITTDNGGEFGEHEFIAQELAAQWYFCHPHCSYERGLNEGTNRLIRDFFPKGTDFRLVSDEEIQQVQNILNSRVRKTLGFKRPANVVCEMLAA